MRQFNLSKAFSDSRRVYVVQWWPARSQCFPKCICRGLVGRALGILPPCPFGLLISPEATISTSGFPFRAGMNESQQQDDLYSIS